MKKELILIALSLIIMTSYGQVGINNTGSTPAMSSMLDVSSTSKGVLLTRMTSDQRKAIPDPAMGLLVYDTDRQTIYLFDGVNWKPMMVTVENLLPLVSRQPEGGSPSGNFGASVDIYGNYAVVGATHDTVGNLTCGAAYIYFKENGTWKQQAKLTAPNAALGDMFGTSVSIYNDIVVIGAPYKSISGIAGRGRIYVFKRVGRVWNHVTGLQASNGLTDDHFGASVAIDGQMIIAGAPNTDYNGKTNAGSAYIFRYENNNWIEKKIINPADAVTDAQFGFSVDISGYTAAMGAPKATASFTAAVGAVYTYDNIDFGGTNWVFGQKLIPDFKQADMEFGYTIDIEQNRILVGAPYYDFGTSFSAGTVVQFNRINGTWTLYQTEVSLNPYDQEGAAVAIDGIYNLFCFPGWQQSQGRVMLTSQNLNINKKYFYDEDKDANRSFGKCIAAHNGQFIVGTSGSSNNGAVFFGVID